MTRAARRWLLALVESRICATCRLRIVDPHMVPWSRECAPCRVRRLGLEDYR